MHNLWFHFDKRDEVLSIFVSGDITGEHAEDFFNELRDSLPIERIDLRINSMGGCAFTGTAIYNRLAGIAREGTPVHASVEGVCSSAAAIIAMSADEVTIPESGFMHVHMPTGDDKRLVDLFSATFVRIIAKRTGRSRDEIATLLANGRWLNGRECLWERLADTIVEPVLVEGENV